MNATVKIEALAAALEVARRVIEDNIVYYSADPAECRACGADLIAGETHRPGCLVDAAERVLLHSRGAVIQGAA